MWPRMGALELKVPPVPLAAGFAAAMFGLSLLTPSANFVVPGSRIASLGLALLGAALALAGVIAFRASKTTVNPLTPGASSTVVSTGVYRLSRNPMYLGFLLALAAWAVYLSNALAVLLLPAFVAYMNQFQIKPEERALLAKFGSRFSQYMATVRRWV
jgi:protein-S-isoprenylcysteine O-methyltransferase Ste14